MKKQLTAKDLEVLREAHLAVRGTIDYQKYLMEHESKFRRHTGYTAWKWIGWYIPYSQDSLKVKKVGQNVYLMTEPSKLNCAVDRWKVTEEVNELLKIW